MMQVCYHKKWSTAFKLAALNELEVKVVEIMNSYVTAPYKEKVWTIISK